jgi:hypothetical protein
VFSILRRLTSQNSLKLPIVAPDPAVPPRSGVVDVDPVADHAGERAKGAIRTR